MSARRASASRGGWDGGDPWEVDSDDEEFVARQAAQQQQARGNGSKGFFGGSSGGTTSRGWGLWGSSSPTPSPAPSASGSLKARKAAPPARPHPASLASYLSTASAASSSSASSAAAVSPSSASSSIKSPVDETPSQPLTPRAGAFGVAAAARPDASGTAADPKPERPTSWLIVDGDARSSSPSRGSSDSTAAGRIPPPRTSSSSAKGKTPARNITEEVEEEEAQRAEAARAEEATLHKHAICDDAEDLLADPTAALARIELRWAVDDTLAPDPAASPPPALRSPLTTSAVHFVPPSPSASPGPGASARAAVVAARSASPAGSAAPSGASGGPHVLRAKVAGGSGSGLFGARTGSALAERGSSWASSPQDGDESVNSSRSSTPYQEVGYEPIGAGDAASAGGYSSASLGRKRSTRSTRRQQQFLECLQAPTVDLAALRALAWKGVPRELRPIVWQILLGYLPASREARPAALARKRAEYQAGVSRAFAKGTAGLDQAIWHQISIDVPRTNPGRALWQRAATQRSLERILYVWAIRHPACGYVQGINDLATPFFEVFLSAYIDAPAETFDPGALPEATRQALEADTFWCLGRMLDGIQDNYIFAQPGIQRQVRRLGELVARIDAPLHAHLQSQSVEYMQFAFRWMNCLLMREMAVPSIVRLWDTYLAEGTDAFSDFHLYVCAVFLHKWSAELQTMDFQGVIMHLQSLPTQDWSDKDAEMLLSEAFMYKTLFGNTAHLNN